MDVNGILVAIDASPASEQVVQYVAQIIRGKQDCRLVLLHVPGPMPPKMLQHAGTARSHAAEQSQASLDDSQAAWAQEVARMIQPVFTRAQVILRQSHIPDDAVQTQISMPISGHNLDACILEAAQEHACGTIVVGRGTFSWVREFVEPHVADKLIQAEHGEAIWVIPETPAHK